VQHKNIVVRQGGKLVDLHRFPQVSCVNCHPDGQISARREGK
jgi:hypothetical protein